MKGPENTFIASVHRHMPSMDDLYRMKTHNEYISGPADMWYSGQAKDLWVEYKFIALPKRDATVINLTKGKKPELSVLQQDWLNSRYDEGRNVWVIVGCKEGGVIFQDKAWMNWHLTSDFKAVLQTRAELANSLRYFLESQ